MDSRGTGRGSDREPSRHGRSPHQSCSRMPHTDRPQTRLVAVLAVAAGPGMAILHERGTLPLGPPATLWPIGFIVWVAAVGAATGLRIAARASRRLGAFVVATNLLVLLFYGFLLLFFGLGGSR